MSASAREFRQVKRSALTLRTNRADLSVTGDRWTSSAPLGPFGCRPSPSEKRVKR